MSKNRFMTSTNPFIGDKSFSKNASLGISKDTGLMTVSGAVNKSIILSVILLVSAVLFGKILPFSMPVFYGSMFGGLAIAMISYSKPTIAPYTAPLYAVVEGILVGTVTYFFIEILGPGIAMNAVLLTILCLVSMLLSYKFGLIKPTKKFRSFITTATGSIMMIYLLSYVLSIFNIQIPYLHQANLLGIGISVFIICIASLRLIVDFDNIVQGANAKSPKYMEWVCGIGLLMTLVWLYIEILQLLAMLAAYTSD